MGNKPIEHQASDASKHMTSDIELILRDVIPRAWGRDTSMSPPDWSENNRATGQCGPTACVVQDYLGGDILYCVVRLPCGNDVSHYCNMVDGRRIDLT